MIKGVELRIVNWLLDEILADESVTVRIWESEDWALDEHSRDRDKIFGHLDTTGIDWIDVYGGDKKRPIGGFMLVYGNGQDLLSDYFDNQYCDNIADTVNRNCEDDLRGYL